MLCNVFIPQLYLFSIKLYIQNYIYWSFIQKYFIALISENLPRLNIFLISSIKSSPEKITIFQPRGTTRQVCTSSYPLSNMTHTVCFVWFCRLFLLRFSCFFLDFFLLNWFVFAFIFKIKVIQTEIKKNSWLSTLRWIHRAFISNPALDYIQQLKLAKVGSEGRSQTAKQIHEQSRCWEKMKPLVQVVR